VFFIDLEYSNWQILIGDVLEKGFSFVMRVMRQWNLEADVIETQGQDSCHARRACA
jgi:hypothetical protein